MGNSPFGGHQGRFLTGPADVVKLTPDDVNSLRIPKVFVPVHIDETNEDTLKEYHFLGKQFLICKPFMVLKLSCKRVVKYRYISKWKFSILFRESNTFSYKSLKS